MSTTPKPTDWHRMPDPPAERCSICNCPRNALGAASPAQHRATTPADETTAAWLKRRPSRRGFRMARIEADGKTAPLPTDATIRRLRDAAGLAAANLSWRQIAKTLEVSAATLRRQVTLYRGLWSKFYYEAIKTHDAEGRVKIMGPVGKRAKGRERIRQEIREICTLLAGGAKHAEVVEALHLSPHAVSHFRKAYPRVWQEEYNRAMQTALLIVRRQAASPAVAENPTQATRRAIRVRRWAKRQGRTLFDPSQKPTLTTFFDGYYRVMRLGDATGKTIRSYQNALGQWALVTGDPPLDQIDGPTLARFRDHLLQLPGRNGNPTLSPNTVRSILRHVQTVLDKTGPPQRGNRDGAGLLEKTPWVKPPRATVSPPRIATAEQLSAAYRAAETMPRPEVEGVTPAAWWRALLVVAYNTGLRAGTLFAMEFAWIDWQRGELRIPPMKTKSRRGEIMHLNATATKHLAAIRTGRKLVFQHPDGCRTFHRDLHQLQDAAGIPREDHFGLHNIRKTLATVLWAESPEAARLTLSHTNLGTTQTHYVQGGPIVAAALDRLPQPQAFKSEETLYQKPGSGAVRTGPE